MFFVPASFGCSLRRSCALALLSGAGWLSLNGQVLAQDASYTDADSYTPISIFYGEPRPSALPREDMPGGSSIQAVGTETGYYDTNPLLLTTGAKPLWGSITTPELIFSDQTPTTTVYSDTLVNANVFNQSNFNSNDLHSALGLNGKDERWSANLQGQLDYDTTRSSELSNYGFQVSPVRHLGAQVAPQITYNALPTDHFSLGTNYQISHYDNSIFTDYQTISAVPSYTHDFDEINSGIVSFQAQHYEALTGISDQVDTVGPTVGWIGKLTPEFQANANVGLQMTHQTVANLPSQSWTTQYTFAGGLTYKSEQDTANIGATRQEYPFGNGTEALLTTLTAVDTYNINKLFSLGGGGSYQFANYQATSAGNLQSLYSANANLDYHATDNIDVVGQYQFRYETLDGTSATAKENMVTLSLTFHPKAWTM